MVHTFEGSVFEYINPGRVGLGFGKNGSFIFSILFFVEVFFFLKLLDFSTISRRNINFGSLVIDKTLILIFMIYD